MVNAIKLTHMQQDELNDKLIDAVKNGDIKNVRELLAKGADVGAKSNFDVTALHEAALKGYVEVAKVLIGNGADVDAKDNESKTALHLP